MMMCSIARRGDRERCEALGVAAILARPISPSELLDAVLAATGAAEARAPEARPLRAGRPLRILLVEDDPVNQAVTASLLERWGHAVTVAPGGRAGLDALGRGPFDLALLDVHLPGMDGFALAAEIRRREAAGVGRVPIVAMTALAMEGDRERCLEAGMEAYLAKPVAPEELFRTVEGLAGGDVDAAALRARVGGDAGLERRILRLFLDTAPAMLARVREILARGDAAALADAAHALRGSVSNFPAPAALAHAERLETLVRRGRLDGAAAALAAFDAELARLLPSLARLLDEPRAEEPREGGTLPLAIAEAMPWLSSAGVKGLRTIEWIPLSPALPMTSCVP
jgi:CheY-like chemotaxis protein